MELALPLLALGSLYAITNPTSSSSRRGNPAPLPPSSSSSLPMAAEMELEPFTVAANKDATSINAGDSSTSYTDKYFTTAAATNTSVNAINNQFTSLTGEVVLTENFKHENMVPFFGGKIRGVGADLNGGRDQLMDSYTGSGSQFITKAAQAPLFEPLANMQYPVGMPAMNDFFQQRASESLNIKMDGVRPFEQQQVAPGIGLGFTNDGVAGFNNGVLAREQWMEKNVDELRVQTNPKATENMYFGLETAPRARVQNAATADTIGRVEKNRPDTTVELGADRLFVTPGAFTAPTAESQVIDRFVNRESTSRDYSGVASSIVDESYFSGGEFMTSTKQNLGAVPMGALATTGRQAATDGDFGIKSFTAYPNNRITTRGGGDDGDDDDDTYFGNVGGGAAILNAVVAPLLDVFRPTRKADFVGNPRIYGEFGSTTSSAGSYVVDKQEKQHSLVPTNRQMRNIDTLDYAHANRGLIQGRTGYTTNSIQEVPTYRASQNIENYQGIAGSSATVGARDFTAEYAQRNNNLLSSTLTGYTPGINSNASSMFNNNVYLTSVPQHDIRAQNNRAPAADRFMPMAPTQENLGSSSTIYDSQPKWKNTLAERQSPDLLMAFLSNPYTHPLNSI